MKTIILDITLFKELYTNRYIILPNISTKKPYAEASFKQTLKINGDEVAFFSDLEKIVLPNPDLLPQLKTLYGIPIGIFEIMPNSGYAKNAKAVRIFETDKTYLTVRNSLLFAATWFEKKEGASAMRDVLDQVFNSDYLSRNTLTGRLLLSLVDLRSFPEKIPSQVTLESTRYDYTSNWFGVFLAQSLFSDSDNRMDEAHRRWFFNVKAFNPIKDEIPQKFTLILETIVGYQVACYTRYNGKPAVEDIKEAIRHFGLGDLQQNRALFLALMFQGAFEPNAYRYYLTAGGKPLMSYVEKLAYSICRGDNINTNDLKKNVVDSLKNIEDKPFENCYQYYSYKNPLIKGKEWFVYNKDASLYPEKIAIINPKDCTEFVKEVSPIIKVSDVFARYVVVAENRMAYENFAKAGINAVLKEDSQIYASINFNGISDNLSLLKFDIASKVPSFISELKQVEVSELVKPNKKVWVLLLDQDFGNHVGSFLRSLYKTQPVELIIAVNYTSVHDDILEPVSNDSILEKIENQNTKVKGGRKKAGKITTPTNLDRIADLQSLLERSFPSAIVKVLSQTIGSTPWESITLVSSNLHEYEFHQIQIVDATESKTLIENPSEFVLRCVRDTLVFDKSMRYIAMNLNSFS